MEFTELADYPLTAGFVTEWAPSVRNDSDGVTGWFDDPRPLSHTHEAHCALSQTADGVYVRAGWIGAVFRIDLPYQPEALRRTLVEWLARHESLRTTAIAASDDHGAAQRYPEFCRRTIAGADLSVRQRKVGDLRTSTRVYQHLIDYFETNLSPLVWPQCLFATVSDESDSAGNESFLVIFGADHSVMDAYSMMVTVGELQRLYRGELTADDPGLTPVGSHVEFSTADRARGDELTEAHPVVTAWRDFFGAAQDFPEFPMPVATDDDERRTALRQSAIASRVMSAEDAADLNRRCRAIGHTMQSAILAALALAHRAATAQTALRMVMPMHTRYQPEHTDAVGWYVGISPVHIDIGDAESLLDCVPISAAAVSAAKPMAQYPYARVAELLANQGTPRFAVSYVDLRYVADAQHWPDWNVRALRSASYSPFEVYLWIVRTPAGITLSARFPSNDLATSNVHRFLGEFSSALHKALLPTEQKSG